MTEPELILVSDDAEAVGRWRELLQAEGHAVQIAATTAQLDSLLDACGRAVIVLQPGCGVDWRRLLQRALPPRVILYQPTGTMQDAVRAIRDGAVDFLTARDDSMALLESVRRHLQESSGDGLVCEDRLTQEMVALAARVAARPVTVLLSGESGTGKEVFARFIHQQSPRADGPFVAVNCAAIPEHMLEAVLFGFEKGAFTGAHRAHTGKFEQAQGGTLLLDEVSEIDLGLQAKLLRVLQEREVERLCGSEATPIDVRVIATTNRDLRGEVQAGRFREDLYYRLHVFPLVLPALRARPADIGPLAAAFVRRHCAEQASQPRLTEAAIQRLVTHPWPGNVRELENVIQRALVMVDGERIEPAHLRFDPVPGDVVVAEATAAPAPLDERMRDREQRMIIDTLQQQNGSRKATAAKLGISVRTLRYKLQRMREQGLEVPGVAGAEYA
ncbi:two-component system response regulator FlrC [Natronocella acetinitrilica]|uniref:Two-component system response regulator FlrC n=1 Tax=Natronocella acetinitrilica TaxID=414046 RepID=A0AAE3KGU0_9GAMM|nr:sigma-54 dependent transcriptional regulator [Natronocella acetinitrilica]MCP1675607.1 two-component system response regulator FlrC [Natronocella acetinitrilica]